MIVDQLKFLAWNVLLIFRLPLQLLFNMFKLLGLFGLIMGVVTLPFGGISDEPLWVHMFGTVLMGLGFWLWSSVSFGYDSLIFNLTPEGREVILGG